MSANIEEKKDMTVADYFRGLVITGSLIYSLVAAFRDDVVIRLTDQFGPVDNIEVLLFLIMVGSAAMIIKEGLNEYKKSKPGKTEIFFMILGGLIMYQIAILPVTGLWFLGM